MDELNLEKKGSALISKVDWNLYRYVIEEKLTAGEYMYNTKGCLPSALMVSLVVYVGSQSVHLIDGDRQLSLRTLSPQCAFNNAAPSSFLLSCSMKGIL